MQRSHVLVERNFVRILAYYLPEVTHSKERLNKVEQKANELSKMILKRLGENCYYEHIQSKFPQILSEVYKQGSAQQPLPHLHLRFSVAICPNC